MIDADRRLLARVKNKPNLKPLGAAVRSLRQNLGFTQEELADKAAIHANHVGGLERGERNVTVATLFRLAKALRVRPSVLLDDYE